MKTKYFTNWLWEWYEGPDQSVQKKLRKEWKIAGILLVVLLFFINFWTFDYSINVRGFLLLKQYLVDFFQPRMVDTNHTNILQKSFEYLLISLSYVFLGTVSGFLLAIITAWISVKSKRWYWGGLIEFGVIVLWSLPVAFFIQVIQIGFSIYNAALLIFIWFSWLWLHRYFKQMLHTIDWINYHRLKHLYRYSSLKSFWYGVLPQIKQNLFLYFWYSIEANLNWLSLLSTLGVVGLGSLINDNISKSPQQFQYLMIPLLVLISTVLIFEVLIIVYEKQLKINMLQNTQLDLNNPETFYKQAQKINWFWLTSIILAIGFVIYGLTNIDYSTVDTISIQRTLTSFILFDETIFVRDWSGENPFVAIILILRQAFNIWVVMMIFGILVGVVSGTQILKQKWVRYLILTINTYIRIIPSILVFYFINPLLNTVTAVNFIIITQGIAELAKKINAALHQINHELITQYRYQKYSRNWILWQYIFPTIMPQIKIYAYSHWISIIRKLIVFGIFGGGSVIGIKITNYNNINNLSKVGAYYFAIWMTFFLFDVFINAQLITKIKILGTYCYQKIKTTKWLFGS